MTNYLDIKGQNVQSVASDPSPVAIGQVWYNTTSNTAKVRGFISSNTWATGATMPLVGPGQYLSYASGFGTKDAAVSARGYSPVIPPSTPNVVHYDGSTWTSHTGYPDGGTSAQGLDFKVQGLFLEEILVQDQQEIILMMVLLGHQLMVQHYQYTVICTLVELQELHLKL